MMGPRVRRISEEGAVSEAAARGVPELSQRFDAAVAYARTIHADQVRKGTQIPYLAHLLSVAALVIEDGASDEDIVIGALLHDAAEDCGGRPRLEDIRSRFGDIVAQVVGGCTDTFEDPKPNWRPRKEAYIEHLREAIARREPFVVVSLADKLHNARSILADLREIGPPMFERFTAGRDQQLWYYRSLVEGFRGYPSRMADELARVVAEIGTLAGNPLLGTDWDRLLGQEFEKEYWGSLQSCIRQERDRYNVYPPPDDVFAALRLTQPSKIRAVIVGQDPYFRPGQAHGLAFSVPQGVKPPQSLRNILLELRDDGCPETDLDQGNLEIWAADRGVLLLNTTLTVREGVAGSHRGMGWETFTDQVIQHVERAGLVFMLWGNEAQKKRKLLKNTPPEMIIESQHPRTAAFRRSKPFSRANEALSNAGREPIDWCLSK
jgi:uracil-DNA glycosylase